MNKQQLLVKISELLDNAILVHEVTDLKLEDGDTGVLYNVNHHIGEIIHHLRISRRVGRVLLEQYEDDLTKKPEYFGLIEAIDEDEDDEDGE